MVPRASVVSRFAVRPPMKAQAPAPIPEDSHNDHGRENEIRSHIARGRHRGEAGVDQACGESEKRAEDVDRIGFPGRFRCGCGMGKYRHYVADGRR